MLARAAGGSLACALSALALISAARVALATTQLGRASATIVQGIVVNETVPMSFAAVAPSSAGGAIVVSATGAIRTAGGFIIGGMPTPGIFNAHGAPGIFSAHGAPGIFNAHGAPNHPASVTVSSAALVTGPGLAMRLGAFTNNAAPSFDGAARLNFAVGATLIVNPNQTPGRYTSTYAVTVNY